MPDSIRNEFRGTAIALDGDDIDTDRIIPAKYLKAMDFNELGAHVFETERINARETAAVHPFDNPDHNGAQILLVARNFGCGSSREHAPQALHRRDIDAIVGVSFGEIFRDNAAAIGLPCVTADAESLSRARRVVAAHPGREVVLNLSESELRVDEQAFAISLNESLRQRFLTGTWDTLTTLMDATDLIGRRAATLPYLNNFAVGNRS